MSRQLATRAPGPWVIPLPVAPPTGTVPAGAVSMPAPNGTDDTANLSSVVSTAMSGTRLRTGPSGAPQGVVYFPPAAQPYRISGFVWPSNLCIAIDASVVVQLPSGVGLPRPATRAAMFLWGADGNSPTKISNVSLITTGSDASSSAKQAFLASDPIASNVDVAHCFTSNHDAQQTGATNNSIVLDICYVDQAEFTGNFQIHNATNGQDDGSDNYPTSSISGVSIRAAKNSPLTSNPSLFWHPTNVTVGTIAAWNAPYGYGPIQINSGINVTFKTLASVGGTACRVETDGSLINVGKGGMDRGAIVDAMSCDLAVGINCNKAASFTPHGQFNGSFHLGRALAASPNIGVIFSRSNVTSGYFTSVIIDQITVSAGTAAQGGTSGGTSATTLWVDNAQSLGALNVDNTLQFMGALSLPTVTRTGSFQKQDTFASANGLGAESIFIAGSLVAGTTYYASLNTANPGSNGANEMPGITRQPVVFAASTYGPSGQGLQTNTTATVQWTLPGTTAPTYLTIWDSATGGNCLLSGPLPIPQPAATTQLTFSLNSIRLTS